MALPIYEGKAKKIFTSADPHQLVMYFKDDATAFNAQKKAILQDKGILNQKIATHIFKYLDKHQIQSHFITSISEREMLVQAVTIIPLEVIVRNYTAGSLCKRLGLEEKMPIEPPLVEFCYKNDALNDPLMLEDHVILMKLATKEEISYLKQEALKINSLLQKYFLEIGIVIADFKIEFGKNQKGEIILADEITPDGCRLWDQKTMDIMDKDRFRKDLGGLVEAYTEVLRRIEKNES